MHIYSFVICAAHDILYTCTIIHVHIIPYFTVSGAYNYMIVNTDACFTSPR